jgi:hypothetical protein
MTRPAFRIFGLDSTLTPEEIRSTDFPSSTGPSTSHQRLSAGLENGAKARQTVTNQTAESDRVTVRLRDLLPPLIDAVESNRAWLKDFGDDLVSVPQDLYEVVLAYQSMRQAA